jgi:hypothetical protein
MGGHTVGHRICSNNIIWLLVGVSTMKQTTVIIIAIIIAILSAEVVLSWPIEKTETMGTFCVGTSDYQLMPGITSLTSVTVRTFSNYSWSEPITFHCYGDRQYELAKLMARNMDASTISGMEVPTWFEVTYIEAGVFPFKEKQVVSVVKL